MKPKTIGLDTALLVATDRRAYYVRLLSRSDRYMARIAFDYSGETERALSSEISRLSQEETAANEPRVALERNLLRGRPLEPHVSSCATRQGGRARERRAGPLAGLEPAR